MNALQLRILGVCSLLVALCCGIAFAAMYGEYSTLRDGERIAGVVVKSVPYRKQVQLVVEYPWKGTTQTIETYLKPEAAAEYPVGATYELVNGGGRIMAASRIAKEKPSLFLIPGGVLAIALGVMFLLAPRRAARRRAARTHPLDVVADGIARTRNVMVGLAAFLVAAAIFFVVVLFADDTASSGTKAVIWVLTGTTLGAGVLLARHAYKFRDPRNNDLMHLITQRPQDIAWIFLRTMVVKAQTVLDAMIWTVEKKQHAIRLVPEDVDALMGELARRAPHAMRPYSAAEEKRYKQDPRRFATSSPSG